MLNFIKGLLPFAMLAREKVEINNFVDISPFFHFLGISVLSNLSCLMKLALFGRIIILFRCDLLQSLQLWDMLEKKAMTIPLAHDGVITALATSVTGTIASASHDKTIKLWK